MLHFHLPTASEPDFNRGYRRGTIDTLCLLTILGAGLAALKYWAFAA